MTNPKRWQDAPFHLLPIYKFGLGEIISKHRQLTPRLKNVARAIAAEFQDEPHIDRNLERLAHRCGVSENTLRKYRETFEQYGIFRFDVPPYWKRNKTDYKVATRIAFPTQRVEKWLRDKGFLEPNRKSEGWISGSLTAARTSQNPTSNETGLYQEVAAPRLADASSASPPPPVGRTGVLNPGLATQENSHGFGTEFWDSDTGVSFWVDATENREGYAPSWIGARVENEEEMTGTVIGFPVPGSDKRTDHHFLVRYEPQMVNGDMTHEVLDWVENTSLCQLSEEPAEETQDGETVFEVGTKVTGRGFVGGGTVEGTDPSTGETIVRPNIAPNTRMWLRPAELTMVEPEIECRVADVVESDAYRAGIRVRHLKFGDGTVDSINGTSATIKFDDGTKRSVLLAFLQLVNNEADLGFPKQEHDANAAGSVPGDASQGLVG